MHKSDHYICKNCKKEVSYKAPGTKNRNHCPYCLYSVHVDNSIGDRKSKCWGLMVPTGKMFKNDAEVVTEKKVEKKPVEKKVAKATTKRRGRPSKKTEEKK